METKFTPMQKIDAFVVFGNETGAIDMSGYEQGEEIAAFIVRACNAHDQLVAALKLARESMDPMIDGGEYRAILSTIAKALAAAGAA